MLLFDEPVNGLDLDGVRWIRALLRGFADEGRTVLVFSHLMSEMQLIADRVVIIGRGRLIADAEIDEVLGGLGGQRVRVRSPQADDLHRALAPGPRSGSSRERCEPMSTTTTATITTTTTTVLARTGRAEWSRIWSVRSSWVFAAATALAVVGLGTIIGYDAAADPSGVSADATAWDGGRPTGMFALFGILAMAVVTSTADYGTGGIVPTLQWTPRRGLLLAARAGVIVATVTLLGVLLVAAGW